MRTALITGGNGNIGRLIAAQLLEKGVKVVKFDMPGTEPESLAPEESVVIGDIRDQDKLKKLFTDHKPDTVYHLASLLSGSSEADIDAAWDINATASFQLMKLAMAHNVETFFFASTIATYASGVPDPLPEEAQQWPDLFYGVTKVAVERLGVYFKLTHGLDFRCLRFPLVLSPYAPKAAMTAFPSHAFKAAATGQPSFTFPVNASTGMSTLFLDDVISSIIDVTMADRAKLTQPVYSLHSYLVTAGMVEESIKDRYPDFVCDYVPDAKLDDWLGALPNVIIDEHARHDWGWQPAFDYETTVARMFELFSE